MAKSSEVILLERIDPLGQMGDIVNVKPGFARNYLLPQKKALRATEANVAYFKAQKKELEALNDKKKKQAEKVAKDLEGLVLVLVRQAGDKGQLYGSVTSRDICDGLAEKNIKIARSQINLNTAVKEIGLFPVEIILHPEVRIEIEINVARNEEEAKIQKKTGKGIIAEEGETTDEVMARAEQKLEEQMEEFLEEEAFEAEKEKLAEEKVAEEKVAEEKAGDEAKKAETQSAEDTPDADAASTETDETAKTPDSEDSSEDKDKAS